MNNKTEEAIGFIKALVTLIESVDREYCTMLSDKAYYDGTTFNISYATTSVWLIERVEEAKTFAKTIHFNRTLKNELLKEIKNGEHAVKFYHDIYANSPIYTYDEVRDRIFEKSLVDGDVKKFIESLYE